MKEDEIRKMAKVLYPNPPWRCEICIGIRTREECPHIAITEKLINAGYSNTEQTVKAFAEEIKDAFYINNFSNTKRIDEIIDDTAREFCKRRQSE